MKRQLITRQYSLLSRSLYYVFALIVVYLFSIPGDERLPIGTTALLYGLAIAIIALWAFSIYKSYLTGKKIKARTEKLSALSQSLGAKFVPEFGTGITDFGLMSLIELGNQHDRDFDNIITSKDWSYCDYSYAIYRRTRNGEYKSYTQYYGVMMAKLPRALPNVFFDSMKSGKRQFRFQFTREQKHSLEGNFDKHFVTYFPVNYTIDSMSFISPEVMWAMVQADDYDIEIIGDRLFLYGPLFEPKDQITDMSAKILEIKKKLMNNIVTYRDERLPFELGRQRVALQGQNLKRSQLIKRLLLAALILYLLLYFGSGFISN